jgi:predicted amidohydrolase
MVKPFKLAVIQFGCPDSPSKDVNFERALIKIREAASNGAQLVLLPEYAVLRVRFL